LQQEVAVGISEITNQGALPQSTKEKKIKEPASSSQRKADKAELSLEARSLFEAGQQKRLDDIQQKIQSNFYFGRDVTEKVVTGLIKDLMK
jgi:hypothetical protein